MTDPLPLDLPPVDPDEFTAESREVVRRDRRGRMRGVARMWRWRCACRRVGRWLDSRDDLAELHAEHVRRCHHHQST